MTDTPKTHQNAKQAPKQRPKKQSLSDMLIELATGIIIPTLILKKLSTEDQLGPVWALVIALAFPIGYSLYQFFTTKKVGFIPVLGFFSVLLTGCIGLFGLDSKYFAIKEALIPAVIGLATLISMKTPYPLVKTFLYNDAVLNTDKINTALAHNQHTKDFEQVLSKATYWLAGSFLLSAILNFTLAKLIVTAPSGDLETFNDQVGTMNLLSYPVIVLPCMAVMVGILYYIFKRIKTYTGLELEEIIQEH